MASELYVDKITGKTGTSAGAPITISGDTATLGSGVTFPAGHVLQDKTFKSGGEANTLSNTYTNYYEVSLTLKSATSHVNAMLNSTVWTGDDDCGCAVKIFRHTSATVTSSHTEISGLICSDPNPHDISYYYGSEANFGMYARFVVMGVDTTGGSAGATIYYAVLARQYGTTYGAARVPGGGSTTPGEFVMRLTEVQQ